ncbi:unnamed protein product [Dibothriocephalus latus]|uniref:Uncharacterized protein n=1 Tax=Dibothriocephalus latus TaxID=60516 RepID=A0A3P7QZF5_DIBLA|nr:unnamed protein product [Dibothriocephalus latus]
MDGVYATLRITELRPEAENQPGTLDFMLIPALFPHETARCPNETLDCLNMTFDSHQRVCIRPFERAAEFGTCVEPSARKGVHTPLSRANLTVYLVAALGLVAALILVGTICVCVHKRRTQHRIAKKRNGRVIPERSGSANEQREFQYTRVDEEAVDTEITQPQEA